MTPQGDAGVRSTAETKAVEGATVQPGLNMDWRTIVAGVVVAVVVTAAGAIVNLSVQEERARATKDRLNRIERLFEAHAALEIHAGADRRLTRLEAQVNADDRRLSNAIENLRADFAAFDEKFDTWLQRGRRR